MGLDRVGRLDVQWNIDWGDIHAPLFLVANDDPSEGLIARVLKFLQDFHFIATLEHMDALVFLGDSVVGSIANTDRSHTSVILSSSRIIRWSGIPSIWLDSKSDPK